MRQAKANYTSARGLWMRIAGCLLALSVSSTVLVAQQSSEQTGSSMQGEAVNPVVLETPSSSQTIALLGTDQRYMDLETLQTRRRTFLVYGMGISDSYTTGFQANSGQDRHEFLWNSHIALVNASNHSALSFQYAPTLLHGISGPLGDQVFHVGTIAFGQPITRNLTFQVNTTNTYGTDLARLLSPSAFSVNGRVPIADPSSAVFQFNRGNVFASQNSINLSLQRSPSQSLNFSTEHSYLSLLGQGQHTNASFAQISYFVAISRTTSFNVGSNYHYEIFPVGSCSGYGFSLGISHRFGRYIDMDLRGGPEFEAARCKGRGAGANYGLSISYPLSRRSRVGLAASRSYTNRYLANAQWTDSAAITYNRQLSESFQMNLNSGYARSVLTSNQGAYGGYFVDAEVSWNVSRTLAFGTGYKRFQQVSGGPTQGQNVGLVSLRWNPLPTRIVK